MPNNVDEFLRKIWITRKCRIKASERLYRMDTLFQFFAIYYSLCIVCLSIWNLVHIDDNFSLKLLIASVALTIVQVFVTSKKFYERYINFKINYIALDRIYSEIKKYSNKPDSEDDIERIKEKYFNLLDSIENHNEHDYLSVLNLEEGEKITTGQKLKLYGYRTGKSIVFLVFLTLPILFKLVPIK